MRARAPPSAESLAGAGLRHLPVDEWFVITGLNLCVAAVFVGKMSMEYLREKAHLRPRTNTIGAMLRVRNSLAFATHKFFNVCPPATCPLATTHPPPPNVVGCACWQPAELLG